MSFLSFVRKLLDPNRELREEVNAILVKYGYLGKPKALIEAQSLLQNIRFRMCVEHQGHASLEISIVTAMAGMTMPEVVEEQRLFRERLQNRQSVLRGRLKEIVAMQEKLIRHGYYRNIEEIRAQLALLS